MDKGEHKIYFIVRVRFGGFLTTQQNYFDLFAYTIYAWS